MELLSNNTAQIEFLCRKYSVRKLYAFGSVLTDKFNAESDVDLLVEFDAMDLKHYADNYFDFKYSLQDLLHREIDLLEQQGLKNPYLKQAIDSSKLMIYG